MQEFAAVSVPSIDSASLAGKLTEKSAEGWSVVSIVATGGDVTAYLSRAAEAAADAPVEAAPVETAVIPVVEPAPAAEPAGWAVAPEPAPVVVPVVEPAPAPSAYQPQPAAQPAYQPAPVVSPVVAPVAAPAAAAPAVPAGWYADPAGRFELRYWDGGTWTEHVSRAGQQFTDPPVA